MKTLDLFTGPQMGPHKLPARSSAAMVLSIFRIQIELRCVWILTGKAEIALCILDEHRPWRSSEFAEDRCFVEGGFREECCELVIPGAGLPPGRSYA